MIAGTLSMSFKMTVRFSDDGVFRHISSESSSPELVEHANALMDDAMFRRTFAEQLAAIHGQDTNQAAAIASALGDSRAAMWRDDGKLQWYWAEYFAHMRDHGSVGERFQIGIKACVDRYFYTLVAVDSNGGGRRYLRPPFFESSAPPLASSPAQTRGIVDTVIFLAGEVVQLKNRAQSDSFADDLKDFLKWFSIGLVCEVLEVSETQLVLSVEPRLLDKADAVLRLPNGSEVLMVSRNVRDTVKHLSDIWLNPRAKSVLLSAWTGSGKEVLVALLEQAVDSCGRVSFAAPSVPSLDELGSRVYEKRSCLGVAPYESATNRQSETGTDGASRGGPGILFIDEIHHDAAAPLRPGMLRLLEDNLLPVSGESLALDLKRVLYVFAASEHPEALRASVKPPDLWNRIEYTVLMRHPLALKNFHERTEVLHEYFLYFWRRQLEVWIADLPAVAKQRVECALQPAANEVDSPGFLAAIEFEVQLAEIFAGYLSSPLIPIVSIRSLRAMVKRLIGFSIASVRVHPASSDFISQREAVKSNFREWIQELSDELLTELNANGGF